MSIEVHEDKPLLIGATAGATPKSIVTGPAAARRTMNVYARTFLLSCMVAVAGCGGGGGGSGSSSDGSGPFGLDARVNSSGLAIPTSPTGGTPGQVQAIRAFPALSLPDATSLIPAGDGSNRFFATLRNGVVKVFTIGDNVSQSTTVLDISAKVDDSEVENGMLSIAFDPAFSTNRYFYISYVTTGTRKVVVSRFRMNSAGGSVADPASETQVLAYDHPAIEHFGGWLGFGPDGMLYISTGDGNDMQKAQSTSSLYGKILRVRVNSDASYSIPADNPLPGSPVWAYGLRNPWRCSFDRSATTADGNLWCGDVGQVAREEVNRIKKGANYGWPIYEGDLSLQNPTNRPYSDFEPPVFQYHHNEGTPTGAAVIGGFVYRGSAMPSLVGRYLFAEYIATSLWSIQTNGEPGFAVAANGISESQVQTLGQDPSGEVYAVTGTGQIYRFVETGGSGGGGTMPNLLSATGLFTDTAPLTPAPALIDYAPNAPFWSDGASKQRWFVLPGSQTISFSADGAWSFPVGTITVKHFELPRSGGGTTPVETRVMVYRTDGWAGFTYRWRDDQSDAELVADAGATGTYGTQAWNFPSRSQCMQCHTQVTGRALGLNTQQLNGSHTYTATGRSDNQLRTLNHIGIFSSDIGASGQYAAMPSPRDASASLEARAKAYLDTNCSMCHREGGPTAVAMDLRYATSLADMQLVGVSQQGSVPGVRVVAGNHADSLLWQRATSSASSVRMPPLGVQVVDEEGVKLLADWIDALR